MSPRHFAKYAKQYPREYAAFSDSMWNGFVSVTHAIGLGAFFSFTPPTLTPTAQEDYERRKKAGDQGNPDTKPL